MFRVQYDSMVLNSIAWCKESEVDPTILNIQWSKSIRVLLTTYSDQKVYRALLTTCTDQKVSKGNNRPSQQLAHPAGIFKPAHKKERLDGRASSDFQWALPWTMLKEKNLDLLKVSLGKHPFNWWKVQENLHNNISVQNEFHNGYTETLYMILQSTEQKIKIKNKKPHIKTT